MSNEEFNHLVNLTYKEQRLKIKQIKKEIDKEVNNIQNIKNSILKDKLINSDDLITRVAIKSVINKLIKRKIREFHDYIEKEHEKFSNEIEEEKTIPFKRKLDELIEINSVVLDNLYKDFIVIVLKISH